MSLIAFHHQPEPIRRRRCFALLPDGLLRHLLYLGLEVPLPSADGPVEGGGRAGDDFGSGAGGAPGGDSGGDTGGEGMGSAALVSGVSAGLGPPAELLRLVAADRRGELHLRVPAERIDGDYALSIDLDDIGGGQLELAFIVINDLTAPRFDIDLYAGKSTLLGTADRNIEAEIAAMQAGLGPCQVRKGLGLMRQLLPRLEQFGRELGYVSLQLRPLTYRNALYYEKLGFGYLDGRRRMILIEEAFGPDGVLSRAMDGSTPFRQPGQRDSACGRSWAIHDGILEVMDGQAALEPLMFKVFGRHEAVCTAPSLQAQ